MSPNNIDDLQSVWNRTLVLHDAALQGWRDIVATHFQTTYWTHLQDKLNSTLIDLRREIELLEELKPEVFEV